jgi:hypothetical protein
LNDVTQEAQVAILHVPAVFAEMGDDATCPGKFGDRSGGNGIRLGTPPGLADRSNMIDVD